ncbi:MAG: mannose-6-phosphate isomerase, class I [Chitinophagaceae bacterium]|nr:mannose-6-phosphate isomerase, class I [Chitinophagaceae bacterium]
MVIKNNLFRISGKIQHYQWGGYHFIPSLLHLVNEENKPFAEYWLGAHDNAPAQLATESGITLNAYIQQHPEVLGAQVSSRFKRLPYLLKVLDVHDMLSIQVHPSKDAAVSEYARENNAGIPLAAGHRNYKDDNHKPELMVALSDFWLLHGFKPEAAILETIGLVPEFDFMLPLFREGGYKKLYGVLMEMEQDDVNRILQPLLERIVAAYDTDYLKKESPHFWAARAALTFNTPDRIDRGIFSVYLLNLVHLKEGEAIFQEAGVLHAYLEGQNMEIMANSDNVLRGGLTPKHIDVKELMKHVDFNATNPAIIKGEDIGDGEEVFQSPAPDFRLSRFTPKGHAIYLIHLTTTDIFLAMEGTVLMKSGGTALLLKAGEAAVGFVGSEVELAFPDGGVLYRASAGI